MLKSTKTKAQANTPDRLFLYGGLVSRFGLVQAAIISDLYFWFAKGVQPWRTYQNWADWLSVSTKTIARQVEQLANKAEVVNRTRTRLKGGGLGAYQFSLANSEESKYIYKLYSELTTNKHSTNDLGSLDGECIGAPSYQMVYVESISRLGGLELAYVVNCLAWSSANYIDHYSSVSYLATRFSLNRKSLTRYLAKLEALNLIALKNDEDRVFITLKGEALQVEKDFYEWNEAIRECRAISLNIEL